MNQSEMVATIKSIREQLGCGLRESRDFLDRDPSNWQKRIDDYRAEHPHGYYVSPEQKIRDVIEQKYRATFCGIPNESARNAAAHEVLKEISSILGMQDNHNYTFVIADDQWRVAVYHKNDVFGRGIDGVLPRNIRERANMVYHVEADTWIKKRGDGTQAHAIKAQMFLNGVAHWPVATLKHDDPPYICALVVEDGDFFCGDGKVKEKHA